MPNDRPRRFRRKRAASPAHPPKTLDDVDIAELAAAADTVITKAAKVIPQFDDLGAGQRFFALLLKNRQERYARGDVDEPVEQGPRPTPENPIQCDFCRKPLHAGDEVLSPWGDWVHRGRCHMMTVSCRELAGPNKPFRYIIIPRP